MATLHHSLLIVSVSDHLGPKLVLFLLGHLLVLLTTSDWSAGTSKSSEWLLLETFLVSQPEVLVSKPFRFLLRSRNEVASIWVERVGAGGKFLKLSPIDQRQNI